MGATGNRSKDSRGASEQLIKTDNSSRGITRLTLTLLLVLVIFTTAIVSVYRNELISTVRKLSTGLVSIQTARRPADGAANHESTSQKEPAVSAVAPPSPTAQINPEKSDRLALNSEDASQTQKVNPTAPVLSEHNTTKPETSNVPTGQPYAATGSGSPAPTEGNISSSTSSGSSTETPSVQPGKKEGDQGIPQKEAPPEPSSKANAADLSNQEKAVKSKLSEEFQLPGSIRVKIHDYAGAHTKWSLMIIVDNSEIMSKESKIWKPARIKMAGESIQSVMEAITPGSKIAMKDFLCKADAAKQKGPCPVQTIYDWSEYPFKGLKEKANSLTSGKITNPCGAVLSSLKKDFIGVGNHVPRLLLITCGQAKCPAKESKKALDHQSPGSKVTIDVLAIGAPIKRHPTYALLAKKSGGLFLSVETPAQLQNVLARYKKALRVSTLEKIEIRTDKAIVSVTPDVDLALAPGIYTVVLPKIKGIADSHRAIPNVKIKSGHATVIEVNPKKGKATIKVIDKQRSGS